MQNVENLFLQILLILFPILIYQVFWSDRYQFEKTQRGKAIITVLSLLSITFCMSFRVVVWPGYFFDLKAIPWVLTFLYAGMFPGLLLTMLILLFRFYLGGGGFYALLITYLTLLPVLCVISVRFRSCRSNKKLLNPVVFIFLVTLLHSIIASVPNQLSTSQEVYFLILYNTIHMIVMLVSLYLIELRMEQVKLQEEVRANEKVNLLGQLATSMANEIRTPLITIQRYVQLMMDKRKQDDPEIEHFESIFWETSQVESTIRDYLSIANPQMDKCEMINISVIIQRVINVMVAFSKQNNVNIQTELDDRISLKANKGKLIQVLTNLIKNGIEAMPQGGLLKVRVYQIQDEVRIDIIDQGFGFTAEDQNWIETSISNKTTDTDVRLAISHRLVQMMSGKIEVQSEIGKGSRSSVMIPVM